MLKTFEISLDLETQTAYSQFSVSQGDLNSIALTLKLNQDGKPVNLTDCQVRMTVRKPSGKTIIKDCPIVLPTSGTCTVLLGTQASVEVGTYTAELYIYKDDSVAVSGVFTYTSRATIIDDEYVESQNDWQAIHTAIGEARAIVEDNNDLLNDMREKGTGIDVEARADIETLNIDLGDLDTRLDDKKVDKNGSGQVTIDMLSQGVKDTITGASALTNVGVNGVGYYNLTNELIKFISTETLMAFTKVDGAYVSSTGIATPWSGYSYAEVTTLVEGELLHCVGNARGSAVYNVIFMSSTNTVIQKYFQGNDSGGINYDQYIRVPVGTVKAYFNFSNGVVVNAYRYPISVDSIQTLRNALNAEIERAQIAETKIAPDSLTDADVLETVGDSELIALTSGNTELLAGKIYTSNGTFQTISNYDTLYFPVGRNERFLLANYMVGINGGAFVKEDKTWISSFPTDGANANIEKVVPSGAYYIAISVSTTARYKTITGYFTSTTYKLRNLNVDFKTLTDAETVVEVANDSIALTADNTELLVGQIHTNTSAMQTISGYDTLYFPVGEYDEFTLSNYAVGVYGGAFVAQDKTFIVNFPTDGANANVPKVVPSGAYYIAISVTTGARYKTIYAKKSTEKYKLKSLVLDSSQVNKANHWAGKKVVWLGTSVPYGQNATKSYAVEASNKLGFNLVQTSLPGQAIHMNANGTALTYGSTAMSKAEYLAENRITIEGSPLPYVAGGGTYNDYYRTWENIIVPANADADLWVLDVVPNNTNFATTDWDLFDKTNWKYIDNSDFSTHRTTFTGALLFLMDKIYALNPKARIVLVLGSAFGYTNGKTVFDTLKTTWNMPVIDIWGKINKSPKSLLQINSLNGVDSHPSTFGHEILGNMLTNEMLLIS